MQTREPSAWLLHQHRRIRAAEQRQAEQAEPLAGDLFRCRLHNVNVVFELPAGCPLRAPEAGAAIDAWRERGYRRIAAEDDGGGTRDLMLAETCASCIDRALADPVIAAMRKAVTND